MASFIKTFEKLVETNGEIEREVYTSIEKACSMLRGKVEESEIRRVTDTVFARIRDLRDRFHYDERQISQKFSEKIHDFLREAQANKMNIYLPEDEAGKPRWRDMLPRKTVI